MCPATSSSFHSSNVQNGHNVRAKDGILPLYDFYVLECQNAKSIYEISKNEIAVKKSIVKNSNKGQKGILKKSKGVDPLSKRARSRTRFRMRDFFYRTRHKSLNPLSFVEHARAF